jgi:N-acetylmuramic acid 6-phosphate etherase
MRTEQRSQDSRQFDDQSVETITRLILADQAAAIAGVQAQTPALAKAAAAAADRLGDSDGGRLVYAGAGTSARLGVQDGVELSPTYRWPPDRCAFLIAGGPAALTQAIEGAEDDADAGRRAVGHEAVGPADVLIALAASGRTPFTVATAEAARQAGALTIGIANNGEAPLLGAVDHPILLDTGAELVAGSTRMKAGTAQRAALTTLSTAIMVRLGRVFDGYMVDLQATNAKLRHRAIAVVQGLTGASEGAAKDALAAADGHVKLAVLIRHGAAADEGRALLDRFAGHLRPALAALTGSKQPD